MRGIAANEIDPDNFKPKIQFKRPLWGAVLSCGEVRRVRMKSIAFGPLELVGEINHIIVKDDWLIVNIKTSTPAGWNLKTALTRKELFKIIRLVCKPNILCHILFGFGKPKDNGTIPDY